VDKVVLNLRGEGITHRSNGHTGKASTHGKNTQLVEWETGMVGEHTVYIDYQMPKVVQDNISQYKYGWLIESQYITPQIVEHVKNNYPVYFEHFRYIFTHNQELLKVDDRFKFAPATGFWIQEAKLYDKKKLVSMISSNKSTCEGHRFRLSWVERLKDTVDLYGRGFKEIENKEEGLCDYMFSVAIENGSYSSYFTEKILDCFAAGTAPIYHGSPDIGEYFNLAGIVQLDDDFSVDQLSEERYMEMLPAIKDNLERVKKMEIPEDWFYERYIK